MTLLIEELRVERRARRERFLQAEVAYTRRKRTEALSFPLPEPVEDWLPQLPLVKRGADLPMVRPIVAEVVAEPDAVDRAAASEAPLEQREAWFFTRPSDQVIFPRVLAIQLVVAHHFRISVEDLKSARRTQRVVGPRHIAYWLARQLTDKSLPEIGRRFGGRDHTTILHGCNRVEVQIGRNAEFAGLVETLRLRLVPPATAKGAA